MFGISMTYPSLLSDDELLFLNKNKIIQKELFNAFGISKMSAIGEMERLGKLFAYGATPCESYGHRLRNRYWKCIQCRTFNIS